MVLIMPNDGKGLAQLEKKLTFDKFKNLLSRLRKQKTIIRIPKFTVETEYDLQPILKRMGMTEIFDDRVANFTNMVTPKFASPFPSFGIIKTIESWSPEYGSCRTLHAKFVFSPDVASNTPYIMSIFKPKKIENKDQ
jgi:hypothetical protein